MKKYVIILILFLFVLANGIANSATIVLSDGSWDSDVTLEEHPEPVVLSSGSWDTSVTVDEKIVAVPLSTNSGSWDTNVTLEEYTIDIDIVPTNWDADNPDVGTSVTNNFTFYQNGTKTIDILIGFNDTNYTFVAYSTWLANGHDQYCANFTTDTWSTETNIAPKVGGDPVTTLKNDLAGNSNFAFGLRLYMPKTVTYANLREDFKVMFVAN